MASTASTIAEGKQEVPKPERLLTSKEESFQVATLEPHEHPQHMSTRKKWTIVSVISTASTCVTCASSMAGFAEAGMAVEFHVSETVTILSISLFILGLGLGPLLVGPLSEVYGRNLIYRVSYAAFFIFNWPVAFAPDMAVHLVFRFITGFCGSAFLSVSGGSVSDLFNDRTVASPMALLTLSPFIGPVLGPLISGFINQNLDWRWTFRVLLIWSFLELIGLVLLSWFQKPIFQSSWSGRPVGYEKRQEIQAARGHFVSLSPVDACYAGTIEGSYKATELLLFDHMAFLLDLWNAVVLGILYLSFQAFPFIFGTVHGFNIQSSGMTFLGIGLGMLLAIATMPLWNRYFREVAGKNNNILPPEARLVMGEVGGVLIPFGLFWLAFTTYRGVPWIIPIIASVPFGAGTYFVFTSTFTYLVTAYRPIAASAMAANAAMRSTFAAVFRLFARAMYLRLGTVGATALLAGLTTLLAPLPFIFRRIGAKVRGRSRFAVR